MFRQWCVQPLRESTEVIFMSYKRFTFCTHRAGNKTPFKRITCLPVGVASHLTKGFAESLVEKLVLAWTFHNDWLKGLQKNNLSINLSCITKGYQLLKWWGKKLHSTKPQLLLGWRFFLALQGKCVQIITLIGPKMPQISLTDRQTDMEKNVIPAFRAVPAWWK